MFGLTSREWFIYGVGASIQGALLGAVYRDKFIFCVNMVFLIVNLFFLPRSGGQE